MIALPDCQDRRKDFVVLANSNKDVTADGNYGVTALRIILNMTSGEGTFHADVSGKFRNDLPTVAQPQLSMKMS